jgi:hypothetical protein
MHYLYHTIKHKIKNNVLLDLFGGMTSDIIKPLITFKPLITVSSPT